MGPLFDWDAEEGEQNLKALPYAIDWFDRAEEAASDGGWFDRARAAVADDGASYNFDSRKLSAVFQFAKAMPLLFVTASHIKKGANNKKRKRGDNM